MSTRLVCFLASTSLALVFFMPQVASADEKADTEFRAMVKRFLAIQKTPQAVSDQLTFSIAQQALGSIAANRIPVTEAMQDIIVEEARRSFGSRFGEIEYLTDLYVPIYVEHYSTEELRQLSEFWESPVGVKTVELMPTMTEKSFTILEEATAKYVPEFQQAVDKRLEEAGIVLAPATTAP